ncbi:hypothetical protein FisN_11Hh248 [Fistulifera solaris]|jgi:hypothetical protein|uniref:Plastid lipid-associated protein/fibrillin conserved domain-containing protein n=1 Tax=Fistulifera solaris TaxID=1519565 RepID=A0A1Z5JL13_FISSO|nr:hypothetical protein FisN_11Hh248 [Fistulifera solaris]|eukprot:GAX14707.1 hypothetical protein FisN_11Hh248 [Fistulifera solaris]
MRFSWAFLFFANVTAFSPSMPMRSHPILASSSLRSEPSDVNVDDSDDYVVVVDEVEDVVPTDSEAWVNKVINLLPSTLTGTVSTETRAAINEALLRLESLNPTPDPAVSPLINGIWELKYVGGYAPEWALPSPTRDLALFLYSGGYSPGIFALTLAQKLPAALVEMSGNLEIAISRSQPRVEASIDVKLLGGAASKVRVSAALEAQSGVRLRETYEKAYVLDREVAIPAQLQYQRQLFVTFVDDDLLVVRDGSGVPEVLVRKNKAFRGFSAVTESEEDLAPPGRE